MALKRFVSSNPKDETNPDAAFASVVYGGPNGVLADLEVLKDWYLFCEPQTGDMVSFQPFLFNNFWGSALPKSCPK